MLNSTSQVNPADVNGIVDADLVQVARIALAEGSLNAYRLIRNLARKYRHLHPDLAAELVGVLRDGPLRGIKSSSHEIPFPLDPDSRMPLIREENPVTLPAQPIFAPETGRLLHQIVGESKNRAQLLDAGLAPTRTGLLVGPPGVGKTLAARWIAWSVGLPLLVLDLAAVMSSYLGRTGMNIKRVLEYASGAKAVLLVDEIDAVAKRRDDSSDIGELKRLVTVLLQEIDAWPDGSLLLAATNHPDLLDPAVWRRFETVIPFPLPDHAARSCAISQYADGQGLGAELIALLSRTYDGASFSDLEREIMRGRRQAVLSDNPLAEVMVCSVKERFRGLPAKERSRIAAILMNEMNLSQRRVHEWTGVSRDTLRKYAGNLTESTGG